MPISDALKDFGPDQDTEDVSIEEEPSEEEFQRASELLRDFGPKGAEETLVRGEEEDELLSPLPPERDPKAIERLLRESRQAFSLAPLGEPEEFAGLTEAAQARASDELRQLGQEFDIPVDEPGIGMKALSVAGRLLLLDENVSAGLIKFAEERSDKVIEEFQDKGVAAGFVESLKSIALPANPLVVKRVYQAIRDNELFSDTELAASIRDSLPKGDPTSDSLGQKFIDLLPTVTDLAGGILVSPTTYLSFGTSGFLKGLVSKTPTTLVPKGAAVGGKLTKVGTLVGKEVVLKTQGKKALKKAYDDLIPILEKEYGLAPHAAREVVTDQFAGRLQRVLFEQAGIPLEVTQRSFLELVEGLPPHLVDLAVKNNRNVVGFYKLANLLPEDVLFKITNSVTPIAERIIKKEISSSVKLIAKSSLKEAAVKQTKKSLAEFASLEEKKIIAAAVLEKLASGGGKLSGLANKIELKQGFFRLFDDVLESNPKLLLEMLDMGGLKFFGHTIATTTQLAKLPIMGSAIRTGIKASELGRVPKEAVKSATMKGLKWLGHVFKFDFTVPKDLRFIKEEAFLAPMMASKRAVTDKALELFRPIAGDDAAAARIAEAITPAFSARGKVKVSVAEKISKLSKTEAKIAQAVVNQFEEVRRAELALGINSADELIFDYARHMFEVPAGRLAFNLKDHKARIAKVFTASTRMEFELTGILPRQELKEAFKAGKILHKPIVDVRKEYITRMLSHSYKMALHEFGKVVTDKFGIAAVERAAVAAGQRAPLKVAKGYEKLDFLSKTVAVPQHIFKSVQEIKGLAKQGIMSDEAIETAVGIIEGVQRLHKWFLTVPFPSFTFRNLVTNVFNNVVGIGFSGANPLRMLQAALIQLSGTGKRAEKFAEHIAKTPLGRTIGLKGAFIVDDFGKKITFREIRELLEKRGVAITNFMGAEVFAARKGAVVSTFEQLRTGIPKKKLFAMAPNRGHVTPTSPLGGLWTEFVRGADSNARVLNFLYHVQRGSSPEFALSQVNKFLFDYNKITDIEKTVLRRWIFPFYTFSRKNVGLHLETMLEKPGLFASMKKTFETIQGDRDKDEIPEHLRGTPFLRWTDSDGTDTYISNYGMPYDDIAMLLNGDGRYILSRFGSRGNFLFKLGAEAFFMYDLFRNEPVNKVRSPESVASVLDKVSPEMRERLGYRKKVDIRTGRTEVTLKPELMIYLRNMPTSRFMTGFLEPVLYYDDVAENYGHLPELHPARIQAAMQRTTAFSKALGTVFPLRIEFVNPEQQKRITWLNNIQELEKGLAEKGVLSDFNIFTAEPQLPEELFGVEREDE